MFTIFAKTMSGRSIQLNHISASHTSKRIKHTLKDKADTGIDRVSQIDLLFCGRKLLDTDTMGEVGVENESTINIYQRIVDLLTSAFENSSRCPTCSCKFVSGGKKPIFHQCGHSLCIECVGVTPADGVEDRISCILCHEITWKKDFPMQNEFLIEALARNEIEACAENGSEICGLCTERPSKLFCESCDESLCEECDAETHPSTNRVLSRHKRCAAADRVQPKTIPMCEWHPAKQIEFFCRACHTLVCATCLFAGDHKGHDCCQLPEVVAEQRAERVADMQDMLDAELEMRRHISSNGAKLLALEEEMATSKRDIEAHFDRVIECLQARKTAITREMLEKQLRKKEALLRHRAALARAWAQAQASFGECAQFVEEADAEEAVVTMLKQGRRGGAKATATAACGGGGGGGGGGGAESGGGDGAWDGAAVRGRVRAEPPVEVGIAVSFLEEEQLLRLASTHGCVGRVSFSLILCSFSFKSPLPFVSSLSSVCVYVPYPCRWLICFIKFVLLFKLCAAPKHHLRPVAPGDVGRAVPPSARLRLVPPPRALRQLEPRRGRGAGAGGRGGGGGGGGGLRGGRGQRLHHRQPGRRRGVRRRCPRQPDSRRHEPGDSG